MKVNTPSWGGEAGLASQLEQWVDERTQGRVRGIRVEITEGRIIVHGRTESYHVKQLVLQAVSEKANAVDVTFKIQVCEHAARALRVRGGGGLGKN